MDPSRSGTRTVIQSRPVSSVALRAVTTTLVVRRSEGRERSDYGPPRFRRNRDGHRPRCRVALTDVVDGEKRGEDCKRAPHELRSHVLGPDDLAGATTNALEDACLRQHGVKCSPAKMGSSRQRGREEEGLGNRDALGPCDVARDALRIKPC